MRILADMGVDMRVIRWLRSQGHDAAHLREEGSPAIAGRRDFYESHR
jgi:predicted nuclease of predicted toxin-antitoxin system